MFSIYLVLGIGCLHTKFNQSKGPEGEVGAGSQIKELKQTLLFQTFCQKLTQVEFLNLASGPQLASMDSIHFGVGHFDFIQGQPPPQALRFLHGRGERETSDW